ncbi:hypothetical protein PTKIN_Ptkin16aG0050200 [Pterospermum kingtungense]
MAVLTMETLPLGFRFRPLDGELINHYRKLKINGHHYELKVIPEIDVCKWEPWDLPEGSTPTVTIPIEQLIKGNRKPQVRIEPSNLKVIGIKKTLVFYKGRAPKG